MKHQKKSTYGQGGEGVFFLQQGGEDRPYVKKTINAFFFYFHREKYFFFRGSEQRRRHGLSRRLSCRSPPSLLFCRPSLLSVRLRISAPAADFFSRRPNSSSLPAAAAAARRSHDVLKKVFPLFFCRFFFHGRRPTDFTKLKTMAKHRSTVTWDALKNILRSLMFTFELFRQNR
jgi:hypothetical protein